jgi:ribose 5-phosphate isomerase RpiB
MTANKWKGVGRFMLESRNSNLQDNIITRMFMLPARFISTEEALNIVEVFLETEFEGGQAPK